VRWLGIAPPWAGRGVEAGLLDRLCARLSARGARKVKMLATPPYYFRPGVDTRETGLIATLLELGWRHEATHFNMTVNLKTWPDPGREHIFGQDARGYTVRQAVPSDRDAFDAYMRREWTGGWRGEASLAFGHEPLGLFLALHEGEIAGFAACEVSQCLGGFGPTGVTPAHRGAGLGKRLLWACLHTLKNAGRSTCEIGWVGPVPFYWRACGAQLGPVYWLLTRELNCEHSQ
jgi:predicted N-acetyltransferase YhbS